VVACSHALAVSAIAADLGPRTLAAYEQYVDQAKAAFLRRSQDAESSSEATEASRARAITATESSPTGRIIEVPGGLVHHWTSVMFIRDVDLPRVIAVAQAYDRYAAIYRSVVMSKLVAREGDRFHVLARLKEDAGLVSAVLETRTVVTYEQEAQTARSIGTATQIRQVKNAGSSRERLLREGHDSGYLWRANTFTRFVERDGGVCIQVETIGLSRRFPPLLGRLIEPIARRLGRASVERTLNEFRDAVLAEEP